MKYLSDRSKTRKKYTRTITLIVVGFLCIYFWSLVSSRLYSVIEPLVYGYGSTKEVLSIIPSSFATYVSSRTALANKNRDLEIIVERLENQLAEKDAIVREQSLITSIASKESSFPIIVMYPIAEDVTQLYSTILLSKGYKDGVEKNALVYIRGLQPACEIVEVHDKTSLCELFSKSGRTTEGVTSSSSITLFLSGEGGGNFSAEIPKGSEVSAGESVYLRSNQAFFLGTIVEVKEEEQSTGAKIYVRGAYNPITSSIFYLRSQYAN